MFDITVRGILQVLLNMDLITAIISYSPDIFETIKIKLLFLPPLLPSSAYYPIRKVIDLSSPVICCLTL